MPVGTELATLMMMKPDHVDVQPDKAKESIPARYRALYKKYVGWITELEKKVDPVWLKQTGQMVRSGA